MSAYFQGLAEMVADETQRHGCRRLTLTFLILDCLLVMMHSYPLSLESQYLLHFYVFSGALSWHQQNRERAPLWCQDGSARNVAGVGGFAPRIIWYGSSSYKPVQSASETPKYVIYNMYCAVR